MDRDAFGSCCFEAVNEQSFGEAILANLEHCVYGFGTGNSHVWWIELQVQMWIRTGEFLV